MAANIAKPSFAKVVASATKPALASIDSSSSGKDQSTNGDSTAAMTSPATSITAVTNNSLSDKDSAAKMEITKRQQTADSSTPKTEKTVASGDQKSLPIRLAVAVPVPAEKAASKAAANNTANAANTANSQTPTPSDETSLKADSNSELGELSTKPPSLDGKSITSGTTFNALDEKESLRPDDSASVKAAAEDDDAFSVRGSLLVNSRMDSDVAARVHRIQIGDMPPRIIQHVSAEPAASGADTPHSTTSGQQPVTEDRVQLATNTPAADAMNGLLGQNPDEKLLEAMQTPKDRLFLLRLESDVVNFVQNSKEPFMDLPPSNSFCRMLTHKLADYYRMTHSFEAVAGSVRIYRTPFCRVPLPLSSLVAANASNSNTPPPAVQPKKIMRRGEDGELPASAGPSKPTSEAGSDQKDKAAPAKEKLSREAREEAYNKARERIFGSSVATENSVDNDDGTGVSRASSMSAKDKANPKKGKTAKHRRDDSESFDSRSQYTPFYNHPQHPTWMPPQYVPTGHHQFSNTPMQLHQPQAPHQQGPPQQHQGMPPYANGTPPQVVYGTANSGYPAMPPQAGSMPQPYAQQPVPPRYPVQNQPVSVPGAANSPPGMSPRQWTQPVSYQPNPSYSTPQPRPGPHPVGIPYAYGQLPAHVNPNDPKSQHPLPGSYSGNYNRHSFNPKTQSFIPGNGPMPGAFGGPQVGYSPPMAGPIVPHNQPQPHGPGNFNGPPFHKAASPASPYGTNATPVYGMMRQNSNNPGPHYPPAQSPPAVAAYHNPASHGGLPMGQRHGMPPHGPSNPLVAQRNGPYGSMHGPPNGPSRGPVPHKMTQPHDFQHAHQRGPSNLPQQPLRSVQASTGASNGQQAFGHLPNYGNPATLPQKPTST